MADAHKNFAYSTVATAPSPAASGTSLVVASGQGALFPAVPFNATIWPTGVQPTAANAEIVRVTNISTDTFTITRTQEGSSARTVVVGDQIAATITAKTLTDIENNYVNSWSPYIPTSAGTGVQSLASNASQNSTASVFLFPVTLQYPVRFNHIIVPVQLSMVTSASNQAISNTYKSQYGIYSMVSSTGFSLISSSSFSILETLNSVSLTWNYPTSTATTGYGYGSFPAGNLTATVQMSSYISGTRAFALQFGGEMSLSGGQYWIGLMHQRTTAVSANRGLSVVGVAGQIMNPINMPSTVSGARPFGNAAGDWAFRNTNITGWAGLHMIGFVTATTLANFRGTEMPPRIPLMMLGAFAANSTASILPTVTFAST